MKLKGGSKKKNFYINSRSISRPNPESNSQSSLFSFSSSFSKNNNKNEQLQRFLDFGQQQKEKVEQFVKNTEQEYKQGKINYYQYKNKLNRVLKGKTPEHWLSYYDNYNVIVGI